MGMRALRPLTILSLPSPLLLSTLAYRLPPAISPIPLNILLQQCPRRPYSQLPSEPLAFKLAASFSGKGRRFNPQTDLYTPPPDSSIEGPFTGRPSSGQDAFFIARLSSDSPSPDESAAFPIPGRKETKKSDNNAENPQGEPGWAFGVLDGVGGWSDSGFDSAHFSHGLSESLARFASLPQPPSSGSTISPRSLLASAYKSIVSSGHIKGGGTTACLATAHPDGTLKVANLGDSGFALFRRGGVEHYSDPQTHAFNTPFQLSIVPPRILALSRAFGGGPLRDMPRDAKETKLEVKRGDVFVFGTDGVWDNLTPQEVGEVVWRAMRGFGGWREEDGAPGERLEAGCDEEEGLAVQENTLQKAIAAAVVGEAKMASMDSMRDGPFAREVQRLYPDDDWRGGKVDDICVVVGIVVGEGKKA